MCPAARRLENYLDQGVGIEPTIANFYGQASNLPPSQGLFGGTSTCYNKINSVRRYLTCPIMFGGEQET